MVKYIFAVLAAITILPVLIICLTVVAVLVLPVYFTYEFITENRQIRNDKLKVVIKQLRKKNENISNLIRTPGGVNEN